MPSPSFWDQWEWARAHQKPEPKPVVDNSRADSASMAVIPATAPVLVPPINRPAARPPSDADFGFDAVGPGLLSTSVRHPLDALAAGTLGLIARRVAEKQYPGTSAGGRNGEGDAFRHAYWNAAMAKAIGPDRAQAFAHAVEVKGDNPVGERRMDLYNNREGRALATQPGPLADTIRKAITDGVLRTRPF